MTSKERAKLRSLAANENALFQVGKGGISDELVKGIGEALDKRELVKARSKPALTSPKSFWLCSPKNSAHKA